MIFLVQGLKCDNVSKALNVVKGLMFSLARYKRHLLCMMMVVASISASAQVIITGAVITADVYEDADSSPSNSSKKLAQREQRLVDVTRDLGIIQSQLMRINTGFQQFQRTEVYTNSPAAEIYQEIKAIEKVLVEKRRQLQAETLKSKGAHFFIENRSEIMKKKRALLNLKVLVANEIMVLRLRVAQDEARKTESD